MKSTSTPAWASSSGPLVSGPNSAGGNLGYGGPNNQRVILYDGTISNSLEIYDIASGQWYKDNSTTKPPVRNSMASSSKRNGIFYMFGGETNTNPTTYLNDLWAYDSSRDTWTSVSASGAPATRQAHTATMLPNGKLVILGGADGSHTFPLTQVSWFDTTTNAWTTYVRTERRNDNHIVVFGGDNGNGGFLGDTVVLDMSTSIPTWSAPSTAQHGPSPRYGHSAVMVGSNMIVFFGQTGSSTYDNGVYVLDTTSYSWTGQYTPNNLAATWTNSTPINAATTTQSNSISSHPSSTSSGGVTSASSGSSSTSGSSGSSPNIAAITGGVVGGVVGLAAVGVAAFLLGRRQRHAPVPREDGVASRPPPPVPPPHIQYPNTGDSSSVYPSNLSTSDTGDASPQMGYYQYIPFDPSAN